MECLVKFYLCDSSVVLPLVEIIFKNILETSIYPNTWKLANVTPTINKEDKQLVKDYRPISLLPICGKLFEKLSSLASIPILTTIA